MRLALISLCLFFTFGLSAQRPNNSPTGIPDGITNPYGTSGNTATNYSQVDSTERPEFIIYKRSIDLSEDKMIFYDSLISHVHRIEPYYKEDFINGNLGSENSAGYSATWSTYNLSGLDLGFNQYNDLINRLGRKDIYDVNRSLWKIHYQKGYSINSSNVEIDFYRRFNKELLLNFNYDKYTDDSWQRNQPNELGNIDLKFFQDKGRNKRKSYMIYSRNHQTEVHSRTLYNGENAQSEYSSLLMGLGNKSTIKQDSIGNSISIQSELLYSNEKYSFLDASITETELVNYGLNADFSNIEYYQSIGSWTLKNMIQKESFNRSIGLFFNISSQTLTNTIDTSGIIQLETGANFKKTFSDNSLLTTEATWTQSSQVSDLGIETQYHKPLQNGYWKGDLSLNSFSGSLFQKRSTLNNFVLWDNVFSASSSMRVQWDYFREDWSANIILRWSIVSSPIVNDDKGWPIQLDQNINSFSIELFKKYNIWIFDTEHRLLLQQVNSEYILQPNAQLNGNVSIHFDLFKKRADLKSTIGFDYYIIPDFKVPSFNPLFGTFYNDRSMVSSNNILLINPYASFNIDNFHFYLKATNGLRRVLSGDRYLTREYDFYDYRVSFGIKWKLLD
jgi:hypothetical protein